MAYAALTTSIVIEDNSLIRTAVASEAIVAGACVRKGNTGRFEVADSNAVGTSSCDGVALSGCPANGTFTYAPPGAVVTVSGLTPGETYFLGGGADEGKVGVRADVVTGTDYATVIGLTLSATRLFLVCKALSVVPA